MSELSITVTGNEELMRDLKAFTGSGELSVWDGLDESGFFLTQFIAGEVFVSRGRVINEPWAPLTDAYAAWKARSFPGRPPLIKSGEMMRGFKHKAGARRLEVWNTADYFDFLQDGTKYMPPRVMMKVDYKREVRIGEFIAEDLAAQMRKAGLA